MSGALEDDENAQALAVYLTAEDALADTDPENRPRHLFFPWQRISVIEHIVPEAE